MAEELGAKCSTDMLIIPFIHVVTLFATAEESQEAELEEIILVHPKWLHACYNSLQLEVEIILFQFILTTMVKFPIFCCYVFLANQ